jgi:hypothetical protein
MPGVDNQAVSDLISDTMRTPYPLILCALLAACGGGGGSPTAGTPPPSTPTSPAPPTPAATLSLSSPTVRTLAGGSAIPVTATLSSGGAVHWQLAAGAPGTLSAATGATVRYLPPAGPLAVPATVTVTASGDGASAALTLAVTPDPGEPGLYEMAWRNETDPTMSRPVRVAADLAGSVYVLLQVDASPTRRGPPELVRIAPDGTITKLIGGTWFGQPSSSENANRLYYTAGFVPDRAGNLYFSVPAGLGFGIGAGQQVSAGPAILKITPMGVISVLAGSEGAQTGAITDGTGSAARFLLPQIVGIDVDDNIYVLDRDNIPRKVTPAGVVTTLSALPASVNADMNGNTYSYDDATSKLVRTSPEGVKSVDTSAPYCTDFVPAPPRACLLAPMYSIVPAGGASYVMLNGNGGIRRLVLRH